MSELDEVLTDLASFADEESEAAVDADGKFLLQRNGSELTGMLRQHPDGQLLVETEGSTLPYVRYLTHNLARLDVLAQRLIERRASTPGFVNAPVSLQRAAEDLVRGDGLTLLNEECSALPPFSSRILFITADAGHGKTALLREHQYLRAEQFLLGQSHYLFWHLDLQGRQLLRLSEALMGDLADLRLPGLWMPAVVRLMRRGALVVGVDGFDELAAEQGGVNALGALASLVSQLGGRGAVVAASRRTFFDTDDYLRRGGLVRRGIPDPCQFDQLELDAWTEREVTTYFATANFNGSGVDSPSGMYKEILAVLGGDRSHPLITRPFLISQIAKASAIYNVSPREFLSKPDDPYSGVASVVSAFVKREVAEKWKVRETGEPFLTEDQHLHLLADVAEEMQRNQTDRLPLDIIETIATLLLDQWGIDANLRPQIIEMVRMHVLLVAPAIGDQAHRSFDHPEFRDYFFAYSLRERVRAVMTGERTDELVRALAISQMSDSTARYVCSMLERNSDTVGVFLRSMESALVDEWRPTHLQQNLGTLIPFLVDGVSFTTPAEFGGKVIYSSLAFESTKITGVTLRNGTFVNVSLRGAVWKDVTLESMALGELQLDDDSRFENVHLIRCPIEGIRIQSESEEAREYAPLRIRRTLEGMGLIFADDELPIPYPEDAVAGDSVHVRLMRKLLRMFNRTTIVSDDHLRKRFGTDFPILINELIPFLTEHEVVVERKWKGAGNRHRAWTLATGLDALLAAEGTPGPQATIWRDLQDGI